MSGFNKEQALEMFKKMLEIRKFEEKLYFLFATRAMPGSMHQYNGEEAVAVGVCAHLNRNDYITSTHRGHGHCLAKGVDINHVMAEMFAKSTGCNKGMGGSMHIADFGVGMLGANGIVGAGIPQAAGAAWSCQYRGTKQVAVCFFGDGAANEGAFHEGVNIASIWKLPVVFVCENNLYGFSTHYRRTTNIEDIAKRAGAYGIPGVIADGMDISDVFEKAGEAVQRARNGEGPTLLECKTYRFKGHSRFERPTYRTQEEVDEWLKRDPITLFERYLIETMRIEKELLEAIYIETDLKMDAAVQYAEQSPDPLPDSYQQYIYA